jgi:hypothetical protein
MRLRFTFGEFMGVAAAVFVSGTGAAQVYGTAVCNSSFNQVMGTTSYVACNACISGQSSCNIVGQTTPGSAAPCPAGTSLQVSNPTNGPINATPVVYLLHWGNYWAGSAQAQEAAADNAAWYALAKSVRVTAPYFPNRG